MKVTQASCHQGDIARFGARAGNQCVCNGIMFLHALHLGGTSAVLQTEALDAIMEEGARLDARLERELQKKLPAGGRLPVYRLGDEVPRRLESRFGRTVHALSRPFNGTTETCDLDGYMCPGIFDFLRYAHAKPRPTYVLVTVNSLARAVVFTEDHMLVFDPHSSAECHNAAVYHCEGLHQVLMVLTGFGVQLSPAFYYEALFLYMLDVATVPEAEIAARLVSTYRDRDIDLTGVVRESADTAATTTTAAPSLPPLPDPIVDPGCPPGVAPSIPVYDPSSSPKKTPEKRRKDLSGSKHGGKKKPPSTTSKTLATASSSPSAIAAASSSSAVPPSYSCGEGALPALGRYQQLVDEVEQELKALTLPPLPANTSAWTLHAAGTESGANAATATAPSFDEAFLTDRLQQLIIHAVNQRSCLRRPCGPQSAAQQAVRAYLGLSKKLDAFLLNWLHHGLDLQRMHDYLSHKTTKGTYSTLDRALLEKMQVVFDPYGRQHGPALIAWVEEMLRYVESKPTNELSQRLQRFVTKRPMPVSDSFVCLRPVDFQRLTQVIEQRRRVLQRQREEYHGVYEYLAGLITSIDIHDLDASDLNRREILKALQPLDDNAKQELFRLGNAKMLELQMDLDRLSTQLLTRVHNHILNGFLPVEDLKQMERVVEQVLRLFYDLRDLKLCDGSYEEGFVVIREQLSYLMTGTVRDNVPLLQEILQLRHAYQQATQQNESRLTQIHDLLHVIETLVRDPGSRGSALTLALVQEQLAQLEALGGLQLPEVQQRLQNAQLALSRLYEEEEETQRFLDGLSYDDPPTEQTIKRHPQLREMLRRDEQTRLRLINAVLSMFHTLVMRLARDESPRPTFFDAVSLLLQQLPPDSHEREDLRAANATYAQMVKKLEQIEKAGTGASEKRFQALRELVYFFRNYEYFFQHMVGRLGVGPQVTELYERYQHEMEEQHLERLEREWQEEAGKLTVTSVEDVQRVLARAPSHRVMHQMQQTLTTKMQDFLDKEKRKQEEQQRQLLDGYQKKVQQDLQRVVDAVKGEMLSTIPHQPLEATLELLLGLDQRAQPLLDKFNQDLLSALQQLSKKLDGRINECLHGVLTGDVERRCHPHREAAMQTQASLNHLDQILGPQLLIHETQQALQHAVHQAQFIEKCQQGDPTTAITGSEFESDFARYRSSQQKMEGQLQETRQQMTETSERLDRSLRQDPGSSSVTRVPEKPFKGQELAGRITPPPADFQRPVFKTLLDQQADAARKALSDEADLLNQKVQTQLRQRDEQLSTAQNLWTDLVTRHKMSGGLDVTTPDAKALMEKPLETLRELLGKATQQLPYLSAERTVRWMLAFLEEALAQITADPTHPHHGSRTHYRNLQQQAVESAVTLAHQIEQNAACENFIAQHQEATANGASTPRVDMVQAVEAVWQRLEPGRVAGGAARHQKVQELLQRLGQTLGDLELQETLATEYFALLHGIQTFSYGLDFRSQLEKIRDLRTRFAELAKRRGTRLSNEGALPNPRKPQATTSLGAFTRGLNALERHVQLGHQYLLNKLNGSSLVYRLEDIPSVLPPTHETDPALIMRDRLRRLCFARHHDTFLEVVDVFGMRQIVTQAGEPIHLVTDYGNVAFKYLALRDDGRPLAWRRRCSGGGLKNVVTTRYKAITVAVAVCQTLRTFWPQISQYDLRPYLTQHQSHTHPAETHTLHNLKLFCYLVSTAWHQRIDTQQELTAADRVGSGEGGDVGEQRPDRGTVLRLSLQEFCVLIAALYPEYIYTVLKYPVQMSLPSLTAHLHQDVIHAVVNNTHKMPPDHLPEQVKAFCITPTQWPAMQLNKLFWENKLVQQLCQVGPQKSTPPLGKLWLYAMATLVFPQDMLQCLWLELKPQYAETYASVSELVQTLFQIFTQQCEMVTEGYTQPQLPTGEPVLQMIRVRRQDTTTTDTNTTTEPGLLDVFIQTETALDYALGSWLFGIPVCFGVHVADLLKGQRVLVARHLEYTSRDRDFLRIQRSRDLNLSQLLQDTWTETPLEHCWLQAQIRRLRDYLRFPTRLEFIPLVIYNAQDHTVVRVLRPPSTFEQNHSRLMLDEAFPTFPLYDQDDNSSADNVAASGAAPTPPVPFNRVPVNIQFLRENPPPIARVQQPPRRHRHRAAAAADDDGQIDHVQDDTSRTADSALVSTAFGASVFQENRLGETPLCRDELVAVAPGAASTSFASPPITVLTQNVLSALEILRLVRLDLRQLAQSVQDTIQHMRFLYLL
ncbi:large tegument protein [Human betaherpesvirus 5]|nr:large tegument protein [Human betaherpesvirus 5]